MYTFIHWIKLPKIFLVLISVKLKNIPRLKKKYTEFQQLIYNLFNVQYIIQPYSRTVIHKMTEYTM